MFDSQEIAQEAIEEINGFPLFNKPLKLALAKSRSDKTVELQGNAEELEAFKQHRQAEKGIDYGSHFLISLHVLTTLQKRRKLLRPLKSNDKASAPLLPAQMAVLQRLPSHLDSNRRVFPQVRLFQTNIFHPTRFCFCRMYQKITASRPLRQCLDVSRDSEKSEWCQAVVVLPL